MAEAFEKNDKGEYIEGYLSDKDHFNGILFILKEPNSKKQMNFWFKDSLEGKPQELKSKRTFFKYKNKLNKLLLHYTDEKNLKDCAYANMIPDRGMPKASSKYNSLSNKTRFSRVKSIIDECHPKVVFICKPDFEGIEKCNGIKDIKNNGVEYKIGTKRTAVYNNGKDNIKIFEINHPGYWGNVLPPKEQAK